VILKLKNRNWFVYYITRKCVHTAYMSEPFEDSAVITTYIDHIYYNSVILGFLF